MIETGSGEFARKLCKALGAPANTTMIELRVEYGRPVEVTVRYFPDFSAAQIEELRELTVMYNLVRRADPAAPEMQAHG